MTEIALDFRRASSADWTAIWPIFRAVVVAGDTYAYPPDISEGDAEALWMQDGSDRRFAYVAELDGKIVGTAYLKPNQIGLGDHVANAGWMIDPQESGRGIGRSFAAYVLDEARRLASPGCSSMRW